jgi:hypothetical protein
LIVTICSQCHDQKPFSTSRQQSTLEVTNPSEGGSVEIYLMYRQMPAKKLAALERPQDRLRGRRIRAIPPRESLPRSSGGRFGRPKSKRSRRDGKSRACGAVGGEEGWANRKRGEDCDDDADLASHVIQ